MNISLQNVDKVSALLTLKLEKADYQARVEKTLKTYRQKANIPGFRPGMVPMSLIKKQFGKSVLVEEVDKMMQEKVNEYIRDNKVNMLGMPLPNEEKMKPIDFDTQEDFEFVFDIALAPEFTAEISAADTVDYYTIKCYSRIKYQHIIYFSTVKYSLLLIILHISRHHYRTFYLNTAFFSISIFIQFSQQTFNHVFVFILLYFIIFCSTLSIHFNLLFYQFV
jgi:hypothetical protein